MSDDGTPREMRSRVSVKRDAQGRVERKLARAIEDSHADVEALVVAACEEFVLLESTLGEKGVLTREA
jgi:hypothetical protein